MIRLSYERSYAYTRALVRWYWNAQNFQMVSRELVPTRTSARTSNRELDLGNYERSYGVPRALVIPSVHELENPI